MLSRSSSLAADCRDSLLGPGLIQFVLIGRGEDGEQKVPSSRSCAVAGTFGSLTELGCSQAYSICFSPKRPTSTYCASPIFTRPTALLIGDAQYVLVGRLG